MPKDTKKRKKTAPYIKYKKDGKIYKIRIDRFIILAIILILIIVLIGSCSASCSKKSKKSSKSEKTTSTVTTTEEITTTPALNSVTIQLTSDDMAKGTLVLINADHPYKFIDGDINLEQLSANAVDSYKVSDTSIMLDSTCVSQLNQMFTAFYYESDISDVSVLSGYRSYDEQYKKNNNGEASVPAGQSEYHSGRTFQLGIVPTGGQSKYYSPEGDYAWIANNAYKYGFIERYPDGKVDYTGEQAIPYVYRYVGIPHSVYIKQNNLCLEEYLSLVKRYTYDNPLKISTENGSFSVYYAPAASSGITNVMIPSNNEYTVSGNNMDGFIIAVKE